ncbi:MAG: lysophospholipid acyltransferase family protein [Planctomycetaceae bacterium]
MPSLLVTDTSYRFIPPHRSRVWPRLLFGVIPSYLRRKCGISEIEVRGLDKLKPLIESGHGILLAPNHCRMSDAIVLQTLSRRLRQPFFVMASSHLFHGSRLLAFVLRRLGAFSVYREGVDRQAVQTAINILVDGRRPLVLFPEGALSQANERLNALMDGVSFIARNAAKKLDRLPENAAGESKRKVFVVPIAIRYLFQGDIEQTVAPLLARIERRLSWRTQDQLPLVERIYRVGPALLALKELEYLGQTQSGELEQRLQHLIDHLLKPLEEEWIVDNQMGSVIGRVKELRKKVLPGMIEDELDAGELDRRWRQLQDMELAQQLSLYPPKYVASRPSVDRILETVERFTEHLSGEDEPHPPMKAVIEVGTAIEVAGKRDRTAVGDPLLTALEQELSSMLERLSAECTEYVPSASTGNR